MAAGTVKEIVQKYSSRRREAILRTAARPPQLRTGRTASMADARRRSQPVPGSNCSSGTNDCKWVRDHIPLCPGVGDSAFTRVTQRLHWPVAGVRHKERQ